jgi:hypothetical protein
MMRALIVLLALSTAGCNLFGPSGDLTGEWRANTGDRFTFTYLTLQQNGDDITGTACSVAPNVTLYRAVPVSGDFPNVRFAVSSSQTPPCCGSLAGSEFVGRQDSSKDIVGTYRGVDTRFEKSDTPPPAECR